jgi:DtxR family Mn-dependent transcriptional regulator
MSSQPKFFSLSQSQADYLKIIRDLISEKRVARIRDIAQRKNVSMPSVTEAMHKLAEDGYITYSAREFIELTESGQTAAHQMASRHRFLSNFLQDILCLAPDKADVEACQLEHYLQPDTIEKMIVLYQFLINCPRLEIDLTALFRHCLSVTQQRDLSADCPECFLKASFPHSTAAHNVVHNLLADLDEEQAGEIVMLGPDTTLRRELIAKGFLPGTTVKLLRKGDAERPFQVQLGDTVCGLSQHEANFIEVAITTQDGNQVNDGK